MKAVAARLRRRYPDVPGEEIDRVLSEAHRAYDGRPIRHFVPIFVERDVRDALTRPRAAVPDPSHSSPAVSRPRPWARRTRLTGDLHSPGLRRPRRVRIM